MKNKLIKLFLLLLIVLSGCKNNNRIKLFLTIENELNIEELERETNCSLEVAYSSHNSTTFMFLYMASREKNYDIFLLTEKELEGNDISNIFVELDNSMLGNIDKSNLEFYSENNKNYGIKINNKDYTINKYINLIEDYNYYILIYKYSRHIEDKESINVLNKLL